MTLFNTTLSLPPLLTFTSVPLLLTLLLPPIFFLLHHLSTPRLRPSEPPLLRPYIPFVGHILSLARESNSYYVRLFQRYQLPICTLPMLSGKLYVINSPSLISAGLRNRELSFDPFAIDFSEGLLGIDKKYVNELFGTEGWVQGMTDTIHGALAGENLRRMKSAAYRELEAVLKEVGKGGVEVDGWEWLKLEIPRAFMKALFGRRNPYGEKEIQAIWDFDAGVAPLALNVMPSIIASKAYRARQVLWDAILPYYKAEHWKGDDVSPLMRLRAEKLKRDGIPWDAIGKIEINIPWASVTNTVPDLFWIMVNVFSTPRILEKFRAEAAELTAITEKPGGGRVACIDADQLEKKPFISSIYWETHRLYNENLGNRRALSDTTIRDTTDGSVYFLEKGTNVQFANGSPHRNAAIWGPDTDVYRPERWMEAPPAEEKAMRSALFPFGGGRNLCPGRAFAISESLGFMSALVLGFDIDGAKVPGVAAPLPGGAMRRPVWVSVDPRIKIRRRSGWEDVEWRFKLESVVP